VVRAVNELRKSLDLAIADRVSLTLRADDDTWRAIEAHRDYVMGEVLATRLDRAEVATDGTGGGEPHDIEIDDRSLGVTLERA
jgi:isoleucyl-tRNA synthetase